MRQAGVHTEGNMPPACRGAGSQRSWSNAGGSQKLHSTNRWPTWRTTVPYQVRLLAGDSTLSSKIFVGAMRMDVSSIQAPLRMRVATKGGEDSTLSIHRSQSVGGVRRRSVEREGSHSRKDGNPLVDGRLTVRCMRRVDWTVERMCNQVVEAIVCFGVPVPKGRGWF
jgi:hypothetical protein